MKDPIPDVWKNKTYLEKWEAAVRLRNLAWEIKKAALKEKHPQWTEEQIHSALARTFMYAST